MRRESNRALSIALPPVVLVVALVACMSFADRFVLAAAGALVGVIVLVLVLAWAWRAETVVLDAVSAYVLAQAQSPALFDEVVAMAKVFRVPVPVVACTRTDVPVAFVVGHGRHHATLCVSEGLLDLLDRPHLRAVVAHELAHMASPAFTARSIAASWSCGLLALTDGHWVLSRLNVVGIGVRALGCAAGQQFYADAVAGRHLGDPALLARSLEYLHVELGRERFAPTGRLVAASALMVASPFGNDVRATSLGLQPDTRVRVSRLEALAGRPKR